MWPCWDQHFFRSLHKKGCFPLQMSSVNVTKSAGNCKFGHIYWRNPEWKIILELMKTSLYTNRRYLCYFQRFLTLFYTKNTAKSAVTTNLIWLHHFTYNGTPSWTFEGRKTVAYKFRVSAGRFRLNGSVIRKL